MCASHPDWLDKINTEGECFDLSSVVPVDGDSLIAHACKSTGLSDFGDELWRKPFSVLVLSCCHGTRRLNPRL